MWEFSPHPVDNGQWVHWTLIANPSNHCLRINFDRNILRLIFWIEILTCLRLPGIIRSKYCQEVVKIVRDVRKIARNWQESSQGGRECVVTVREGVNWKKTFSFGHCPNYLTPPPMTPIWATWSSFFGSRNWRFESQFRTKNTIYTI